MEARHQIGATALAKCIAAELGPWQKILELNCLYNVFTICVQRKFSALHGAYIFYRGLTFQGGEEKFVF